MNYICKTCNKSFSGKLEYHIYKFCSHKCYSMSLKNRSTKRFDKIDRCGYYAIHTPGHPRGGKQGYVFEHILIMEKHIGRYLTKEECVHHINHDRKDNRIENLQLFASHGEHTKYGHPEIHEKQKGVTIRSRECAICNTYFNYTHKNSGKKTCSNECRFKLKKITMSNGTFQDQ